MSWREPLLRFMRVPPMPQPPPGSPPRIFRAAANYFTLRVIQWIAGQIFLAFGPLLFLIFASQIARRGAVSGTVLALLVLLEIVTWIGYFGQLVWSAFVLRLDYEMRWYMVSDRAIRIREGILVVREKTIALANIQNLSVRQGPVQRLLGIADVEVRTAGGGGGEGSGQGKEHPLREPMHVAYFRGVDNAEEIRDIVLEGVRRQKNSGLGDPDEERHDVRDAIRELLAEARALGAAASRAV
ncbi:MAG TPA: PH domain-containing protein [Thermoanaerobaculia bacterium]|nr:PH domain-containing protein [Thermoanaerobaculia bacterium]